MNIAEFLLPGMKKLIVANWKMNPKTRNGARVLLEAIKANIKGVKFVQVVICPPAVWLVDLKTSGAVKLGSQNCHWEASGAFTGELAATMLADAGAEYVILGHSERRQYMGETDEIINLKMKAALKAKLKPILCVGEAAGEEMGAKVEQQMTAGLAGLSVNQTKELIVAYEPVWAISSAGGQPCSPDDTLSAGLFIRKTLTKLYSRFVADKVPVLYGGSVDSQTVTGYIDQARMDGVLVGGASLDAEEFVRIIKNVIEKDTIAKKQ
ncbi:triose-phosphate isomerase [Patescibacteria group bacterium]|nr:triose-phosphate isomerase [Patescibacteria group bacterium]